MISRDESYYYENFDDSGFWDESESHMSVPIWYDLDGELHKWLYIQMEFFSYLLDPRSVSETFFNYENEDAWGIKTVEIERDEQKRTKTYIKLI